MLIEYKLYKKAIIAAMIIKKLGDIAEVQSGATFRSRVEAVPNGKLRVIQMRDLGDDNRVHFDRTIRVNHPQPTRGSLAQWGDIIFRSKGQTLTAAMLDQEVTEDIIVAAPLFLIRSNTKQVLSGYLLWWLNRSSAQNYFKSRATGATVKMVTRPILVDLEVNLPPLEQQRVIAQLFNLSAREQHLLEEFKERKAQYIEGILTQMVKE